MTVKLMTSKVFAVVMAGGKGERFWPNSRVSCPKQFLNLTGQQTMLQYTVNRLAGLIELRDIFIVADQTHTDLVKDQLELLPVQNVIMEPFGRNTAAAVGLAAIYLERDDPDGVMAVLPADHFVRDEAGFREVLQQAVEAARSGDLIVTIGITPDRPETGYGYIECGRIYSGEKNNPVWVVSKFTEKPDSSTALNFLRQGNYLWNGGIFIWKVSTVRRMIREFLPELHNGLERIKQATGTPEEREVLNREYSNLPSVSIDYGIMEKADNVLVVKGDFGWDDVGSWLALERYHDRDEQGNVLQAQGVFLDTAGSIVVSNNDKPIATLGVRDLIIVDTGDSLLVCHKDKAQEIRKVVQALKENGYDKLL